MFSVLKNTQKKLVKNPDNKIRFASTRFISKIAA